MKGLIAVVALLAFGCAGGAGGIFAGIDDQCIAGKLTEEGARALVDAGDEWVDWHGDYVERRSISRGDRILDGTCAESVKATTGGIADAIDGGD